MLAQITDLRLCALMSLTPYVPAPLCLRPYVLRTFVCALISKIETELLYILLYIMVQLTVFSSWFLSDEWPTCHSVHHNVFCIFAVRYSAAGQKFFVH